MRVYHIHAFLGETRQTTRGKEQWAPRGGMWDGLGFICSGRSYVMCLPYRTYSLPRTTANKEEQDLILASSSLGGSSRARTPSRNQLCPKIPGRGCVEAGEPVLVGRKRPVQVGASR